jgi:hypothetical protein
MAHKEEQQRAKKASRLDTPTIDSLSLFFAAAHSDALDSEQTVNRQ